MQTHSKNQLKNFKFRSKIWKQDVDVNVSAKHSHK